MVYIVLSFVGRGVCIPVCNLLGKLSGTLGALSVRARYLKSLKSSSRPFTRQPRPTIISQDRIIQACVVVVGDKLQRQENKAVKKYPTCVFNELHAMYFLDKHSAYLVEVVPVYFEEIRLERSPKFDFEGRHFETVLGSQVVFM